MDAFEALSIGPSSLSGKKYFTPAEATRSLALVRRIVGDVVREYAEFRELHEACRSRRGKSRSTDSESARRRYVALSDHLSDLKEELDKVGCELKDYQIGLVDFPSLLEGREICLCWKLGEEKVSHWHDMDSGYSGRQPIEEPMFGP